MLFLNLIIGLTFILVAIIGFCEGSISAGDSVIIIMLVNIFRAILNKEGDK